MEHMENTGTDSSENSLEAQGKLIAEEAPLPEEEGGYIEKRLQGQMNYYHNACVKLQKEYHCLSILNIIVTSSVPVFTLAVEDWSAAKYIVAVLSVIATACTSILLLHKTKDIQVNYRATYEALKTEQIFYLNGVEVYAGMAHGQRAAVFIKRCEELMGNEHRTWEKLKKD